MRSPLIVITGATSGLGRLAALDLARRGARLVVTARDETRANETRASIHSAAPGSEVDVILGDLSLLGDVRQIGTEIAERYDRIDVLINNAGLHAFEPRITADGLDEMMAVNYFAPWLLTRALLPSLTASPNARIVNVASEASRRHGTLTLPDDLTDITPFTARGSSLRYGKTKLLDIMFTLELADRMRGTAVTANCLDPGFNVTGLGRELRFATPLEHFLRALHLGDPRRGSGLIVELAVAERFARNTGSYITARGMRPISPTPPADNAQLRRELWQQTQTLVDSLL